MAIQIRDENDAISLLLISGRLGKFSLPLMEHFTNEKYGLIFSVGQENIQIENDLCTKFVKFAN